MRSGVSDTTQRALLKRGVRCIRVLQRVAFNTAIKRGQQNIHETFPLIGELLR
ncbi:hypothetical protein D3C75_1078550 [compost metagenome]